MPPAPCYQRLVPNCSHSCPDRQVTHTALLSTSGELGAVFSPALPSAAAGVLEPVPENAEDGMETDLGPNMPLLKNNILPPATEIAKSEQSAPPRPRSRGRRATQRCACTLGGAESNRASSSSPRSPPARRTPGRSATASQRRAGICAYRVSYVGTTERKMISSCGQRYRALCNPSGFASPRSTFTKPAPSLPNANTILRGITEGIIWMKKLFLFFFSKTRKTSNKYLRE